MEATTTIDAAGALKIRSGGESVRGASNMKVRPDWSPTDALASGS
jgi:hypothetical protein